MRSLWQLTLLIVVCQSIIQLLKIVKVILIELWESTYPLYQKHQWQVILFNQFQMR